MVHFLVEMAVFLFTTGEICHHRFINCGDKLMGLIPVMLLFICFHLLNEMRVFWATLYEHCTRNVLTFANTTAIAYRQNSAFLPRPWHHAIVVLFTNVRTLRVG